ncbi:hypothetical protein PoB_005701700 [Plakobranchus ocellatus]|uniref:WW domain-containing protein n=1 Tax=Plakobranchus ocellatus TaxID=259542 RepID=A0AAV4CGV3_9GAST|nr:hypothetical protein PoB_005701700 [Plakobranchus ocellatus]
MNHSDWCDFNEKIKLWEIETLQQLPHAVPPSRRTVSPQQGDLRLSGPPSGQGAGVGARTRGRRVPADLRADSLATVPPTPPNYIVVNRKCEWWQYTKNVPNWTSPFDVLYMKIT